MQDTLEYPSTLIAIADLKSRSDDGELALKFAAQALDHSKSVEQLIEAKALLASILATSRSGKAASGHADDALSLAGRLGSPWYLGRAETSAARAARAIDDFDSARKLYERALRHFDGCGAAVDAALVLTECAPLGSLAAGHPVDFPASLP